DLHGNLRDARPERSAEIRARSEPRRPSAGERGAGLARTHRDRRGSVYRLPREVLKDGPAASEPAAAPLTDSPSSLFRDQSACTPKCPSYMSHWTPPGGGAIG